MEEMEYACSAFTKIADLPATGWEPRADGYAGTGALLKWDVL